MTESSARFQDGRTTRDYVVRLDWGPGVVEIVDMAEDRLLSRWRLDEIRIVPVAGESRALRLAEGFDGNARLTLRDPAEITRIRANCPNLNQRADRRPGWWKPYAYWGGGAVLSICLLFTVIIPMGAGLVTQLAPFSWDVAMGKTAKPWLIETMARLEKKPLDDVTCEGAEGLQVMNRILDQFNNTLETPRPLNLTVLDIDLPNAFALPGGPIIITRGLIDLAEHPNGLAGVIAHEIGHVELRHSTSRMFEQATAAALIGAIFGDLTGGTVIAGAGEFLLSNAYSREDEREADRMALKLMAALGADAAPLAQIFDALEKAIEAEGVDGEGIELFSSHPDMAERIHLVQADGRGGISLATDAEWQQIKQVCEG